MFRFSIRELLLLALIVGLMLAWWLDHSRSALQTRRMNEWKHRAEFAAEVVRHQGGTIFWSDDVDRPEGCGASYTPKKAP